METVKVNAPIIGEYEVQKCPVCGSDPIVDVDFSKNCTAMETKYNLYAEVCCPCCGLSAPFGIWNKINETAGILSGTL